MQIIFRFPVIEIINKIDKEGNLVEDDEDEDEE